jgi:hypothetical protein
VFDWALASKVWSRFERVSSWQNPYVERLIGTVRRECLDRVLIFGEAQLRQILSSYAAYYMRSARTWRWAKTRS